MNKIYKIVWSKIKNTYVVVSEVAKSHSKSGQVRGRVTLAAAVLGVLMATTMPTLGVYAANLTADQKAVYDAVLKKLDENKTAVHYFSVNPDHLGDNTSDKLFDETSNYSNKLATGTQSMAIGRKARTPATGAMAVGHHAVAEGFFSVAIGTDAYVTGEKISSDQYEALSDEDKQLYAPVDTAATSYLKIKMKATKDGQESFEKEVNQGVAVGRHARVQQKRGTAIGSYAGAYDLQGTALGFKADATAENATALGATAKARAKNAVAIGFGSEAAFIDSVALGSYSRSQTKAGISGWDTSLGISTGGISSDKTHVWTSTLPAISIGNTEGTNKLTRQIINVAAGYEDTDAVNVAQLKRLREKHNADRDELSARISANNGDINKLGNKVLNMGDDIRANTADVKNLQAGFSIKDGNSGSSDVALGGKNKAAITFKAVTQEGDGTGDALTAAVSDDQTVTYTLNTKKLKQDLGIGDKGVGTMNSWKLKAGEGTAKDVADGDTVAFDVKEPNKGLTVEQDGNTVKYGIDGSAIDLAGNASITNLNKQINDSAIHYFSVNSKETGEGSNYKNDGAKGKGAVAIGEKALASKGGTVSIGRNAHIDGNGGNTSGEGSVAIGDNALITTNGLDLASIALGKNAKVLNGSGKQERGLSFTPDNFDKPGFFGSGNTLPKNADKVPGGIAIGTNTFARTGSIQLGHHTFAGYKMGGIDVTNANEEANIVGMTTVGTNTYNKGALANMYGAYSIITGGFTGEGGGNSLSYGPQNFGANVVGSLNSIRSKGHSGSSGIANSIVGVANTVENANGTLVYGAGNKITNSVTSISAPSGLTTLNTWEDTVTTLQKSIKDSKSGGAVLAIGGGNVADYVRHSQLVGVNNTVTGTENKVSEFNMVNGYQNTVKNGTHVTMIGSDNEVNDTIGAVLLGDKRKLTGADGSIVLGSADESAETNVKDATVIGHNANTTVASGVALGSGSVADRAGFTEEKKGVFSDVDLNGKTDGAVSVGTKDKLRQIINVGDATEDTDAVNLRQLRALGSKVDNSAIHYFSVKSKDQMANYDNKGAQGERSVAIGPGSTTKFRDSLSVGTSNTNEGYETVLVGNQNKAYGLDRGYEYAIRATLVGTNNTVMSNSGILAMGSENIVYQGIAIGAKNKAMGENAVALGNFSSAMYTDTIGIGFGTHGDADAVIAIGRAAKGDALGGVAIGRYAEVHASTGVALGESSVSSRGAGVVGYMPGTVGQTAEEVAAYLGKAEEYKSWKADMEKNKDAYTRAKAWHAAADAERQAYTELNEARIAYAEKSTEANKKAITEKYDAWKKASDHRQKTDVAMRADNDYKTIRDLNARYGQIFGKLMSTEGAVSVGDEKTGRTRQIINVAAGTKDTDAVNVYQLKVVNAKADKNAEAITNLTNTVNANGKATIVKVDGNENNADGNLKIKKTEKDGQLTYDLSLNDEISLGKAGEDGKDGKIGLTGKDGTSAEIRTGQGKAGVDGKDGETTTRIIYKDKGGKDHEVATLDDGLKFKGDNDTVVTRKLNEQLNITGGITDAKELSDNNIGVVGTQDGGMAVKLSKKLKGLTSAEFKDGDNVTNITAGNVTITRKEGDKTTKVDLWELNKTVNNITAGTTDVSSWKLQANGEDKRTIKKNDIVNFKNGTNTEVTVSGNDITVDLNKKTKDQIQSNTTKIDEIGGKVTTIENNIKNIDQKIEGAKVTVEGDKETGVTVENTAEAGKPVNYKVSLDDKVKVGNVTIDGKDSKGEITGLTNTTIDGTDFAKKGRAATEEQLKAVEDKIGQTGSEAKKHASVTAGTNISVVQDGTNKEGGKNYKVSLAKDIDLGQDGSIKAGNTTINKDGVTTNTVKAGNTTINNDGLTIKDGPAITKTNVDVNNQQIHHVKDGTAVDDAATVGQVNKKIDEITKTVTSSSVTGGTIGEDGKISLTKGDKTTVELQGQLKDISARAGDYEIKDNKVTIGLEDNYSKKAAGNIVIKDVAKASDLEQETKERKDADKVITETIGAANKDELKTSYQDTTYIKNSTTLIEADKALDKAIGKNAGDIKKNTETINILGKQVGNLDTRVNKVGAGAAALAALHPLDFDPDDKWDFAAGYGNYKGANAAAIGAYYRPNEDTMFSVGGSFGGGENMVNAGVSVKLGQGNHVSTSKVAMAKDMLAMQKRMAEMEAQMAKMQGFIGALTGMDTQAAMFPDVPENHWAYEYVKGLCEKGIIEGYPDGNFNGNRSMTRYEFAAMLYRALAKGVNLDARAVKEFAPELGRIRVDVISQNKEGQPVIERVRVNEEKKEK